MSDQGPDPTSTDYAEPMSERLQVDVAMLCELVDRGFEVDGEAVEIEEARWIIYGRSAYDGELILAEYESADEAAAVLRQVPISQLRSDA